MIKDIYRLEEIHQADRPVVGGKAANLGDLARGLRVPAGFCLSSNAYYRNLENHGINEKIREKLAGLDIQDMEAVNRLSADISDLILNTPMLPEIESAVITAFDELAEGKSALKVAVRSSATAEDLPDASFAGLQETFLNIEGIENVLSAVKKCWASLWTAKAIHYRTKKGFDHDKVSMAVIIQEMVPAAVSGVMFTANPVNNSRQEIRIEAVRGLGEQLVSGQAAGDVYIFKKNDVNVELVSKAVSDPEKGQMLNDYDMKELAHTGLKIEFFYENHQDIEWAYYNGKFYFLQTRPVTGLADEELPDISLNKMSSLQKEVMDWVAERFPDPIFPIDGVVVKVLFLALFESMASYGYKIDEMDWRRVEKGIFPEFFTPPAIRPGLKRIWPYLRLGRILRSDPAGEWAAEQVYLLDMLRKLKERDAGLPLEIIIDYITEALHHFHYFIVMRYHYFAQNRISSQILMKFLRLAFKEEASQIYQDLLAGSDNITLEINTALHNLAVHARNNPEVRRVFADSSPETIPVKLEEVRGGPDFLDKFNHFISLYGERETTMGLGGIASPTWRDAPEVVMGILKGMLNEEPGTFEAREEARKERARQAEECLTAYVSRGIFSIIPIKAFLFRIVKHARSFAAFRENSHYDVTRGLNVFRILFTELGERLTRKGILRASGDIFYLTYYEIKDIIETIYLGVEELNVKQLASKIQARKEEQDRRMARWAARGVEFDESRAYRGIPVSQGIATGTARIIRGPRDFHLLRKGDILVAPYTNPAWTPLFTVVSGLVVETGGAASHASIIAREYGIPAVMGVVKATELLKNDEIITVHGTTGAVYRSE